MDYGTILGLVARHALTTLAGWLVSQGIIQSNGTQGFVGACMLVLGVVWSWYQKYGQAAIAAELDRLKTPRRVAAALLALALAGGTMGDVRAANLVPALKAKPVLPSYASDGWYFGLGTYGEAAKSSIGGGDLISAGGSLGAAAGWKRGTPDNWLGVEADAYWRNLGGDTTCAGAAPCDIRSRFNGRVRVMYGGSISVLTNLIPTTAAAFPVLTPPAGAPSNLSPYAYAVVNFDDVSASLGLANARAWQFPFGLGVGLRGLIDANTAIDFFTDYTFAGSGFAIGGAAVNQGSKVVAGVHILK
jgi:hypothetical protein